MKPSIRRNEVLRYMGYAGQPMTPELEQRVDTVIARCQKQQEPHGYWEAHALRETTDEGRAAYNVQGTSLVLYGADIMDYLHGAVQCALLAVTMGMASERELRRLSQTDPLEGLIYDAACSDLVERGADRCEAQVVAYAHNLGLYVGYRYGPGYGDFDVAVQPAFLDMLQTSKRLGLTATESNMLIPAKSITAVIGLYPKRPSGFRRGCGVCACREWCGIRASGNRCYSERPNDVDLAENGNGEDVTDGSVLEKEG